MEFENLKQVPFPKTPTSDSLYDIFSEIVELDGHIAGLVSSLIRGNMVQRKLVFIDEGLNDKINSYITTNPNEAEELLTYRDYKAELDKLTKIILECA